MFELKLYTGKAISTDDPDKEGKIQISIESVSEGWRKDLLPWAIPLISNVSNGTMEMHLPKEGSQVWVLVDKYYKRFYYLSNRYFYNLFDFSKVSGLLNKCDKINKEYKNIDFKYYEDGTLLFHNNSDSSSGIIQLEGTLIYLNSEGSIIHNIARDEIHEIKNDLNCNVSGDSNLSCKNNIELPSDKSVNFSSKSSMNFSSKSSINITSNSLISLGNSVGTIGSVLIELCNDLSSLSTTGNSNLHTSPTLTAQMVSLIPKINSIFK